MIFASGTFLFLFLPVVLVVYYLCPSAARNAVLLVASLLFYGWGEPIYLWVMIGSIVFHYLCGRGIAAIQSREGRQRQAKFMLAFSVIGSLSFLGWFKYAGFISENLYHLTGGATAILQIALPVGISFYTFQALSYVIDVYRGRAAVQKNLIDFATYIALFPQLIAGPIVRYVTIEEQLRHRQTDVTTLATGIRRLIIGLGKKVLLANQAGLLWEEISAMDTGSMTAATAWLGAIAFTLQIYFDFSGYSDMAIGLGRMFGFIFDENFNYPYISRSITEFWRRWHISLSSWFREYVYIPLGGSRRGIGRQMVNICIVWALTGIWHGASWNFLWWGVYFAVLLILEKTVLAPVLQRLPAWLCHVYALVLIVIGWVIFALPDGGDIGGYLQAMAGSNGLADGQSLWYLRNGLVMGLAMVIGSTPLPSKLFARLGEPVRQVIYLLILLASIAFLVSDTYQPFLYFRF